MARVLGVLVAAGSGSRIDETLRSLADQTSRDLEVVVVLVGDTPDPVSGRGIVTDTVRAPAGTGFAEAVHLGLRDRSGEQEFLLLMHDDISLEPHALAAMVDRAASEPDIVAVGAKLVAWDRPEVLAEVGGAMDRLAVRRSVLDTDERDHGQRDDVGDVLYCSDACLLIRRDAFVRARGFSTAMWPFYEDVDLCWRLRSAGGRVVVAPAARVRHAELLATGRRPAFGPLERAQAVERGRLRFMLTHYSALGLTLLGPQYVTSIVATVVGGMVRRQLWPLRAAVSAWVDAARQLPAIARRRRASRAGGVDDRALLSLGSRGATVAMQYERARSLARVTDVATRVGRRVVTAAQEPSTWAACVAGLVVLVAARDVLFDGTFTLGEIRALPTFAEALTDHVSAVRREGLDPFAPPGPGLLLLGALRSILLSPALAEKALLIGPLIVAGVFGARAATVLGLGATGRRWLGLFAAVNPVTLVLLSDGALGPLTLWAVSWWWIDELMDPSPAGTGRMARARVVIRIAVGWAAASALHPPTFTWLAVLGAVFVLARLGDGHTRTRVRSIGAGTMGSFLLLLPWSFDWISVGSPIFGRSADIALDGASGLTEASLHGGWPFVVIAVVAVAASVYVGFTRTTLAMGILGAAALAAGVGGVMPRTTMLAASGWAAVLVLAGVARRVTDALPTYEIGARQAAVLSMVAALGVAWTAGAVGAVASGTSERDLPIVSSRSEEIGRVLWLVSTPGGVRMWATLSFSDRMASVGAAGGPAMRTVADGVEAVRHGRTHRLGSVLGLADVSHVVALDGAAAQGLDEQADLAPLEQQRGATVFRNDAWSGPALVLPAGPADPLTPGGLVDLVRDPRPVSLEGWPYGPLTLTAPDASSGVVYVAGGPRGGWRFGGQAGDVGSTGVWVDAGELDDVVRLTSPGGWWTVLAWAQFGSVILVLGTWITAAYLVRPGAGPVVHREMTLVEARPPPLAVLAPAGLLIGALAVGWLGPLSGGAGDFLSAAWYCPPVGEGFAQRIAVANPQDEPVEFLVRHDLSALPTAQGMIAARARQTVEVQADEGAVVETYGSRLAVAAEVSLDELFDTSLCAQVARGQHAFAEGGRAATRARPRLFERYIVYNPFQDLARVSVRFISPDETIAPPKLQDVRVEPGSFAVIDPEEQFEPMFDLSTVVNVWQGRAVVARRLSTIEQISWSIGTPRGRGGVLPLAVTRDAVTALVAVNPGDDDIDVTVSGAGEEGSLQEQTFTVSTNGRTSFEVNAVAPEAVGLVVRLATTGAVAVESLIVPDGRETVSLLPPLTPGRTWVLPMAEGRSLVVVNPNPVEVTIDVERLGPGPGIEGFTVGPNRMEMVELEGDEPFGLTVRARGGSVTAAVVGAKGSTPGARLG